MTLIISQEDKLCDIYIGGYPLSDHAHIFLSSSVTLIKIHHLKQKSFNKTISFINTKRKRPKQSLINTQYFKNVN